MISYGLSMLVLLTALGTSDDLDSGGQKLIDFILDQNEQTRARINAIDFDFTFETFSYVTARGQLHGTGSGHVITDGVRQWTQLKRITRYVDKQGTPQQSVSDKRWLLTNDFFALWPGNDSSIQLHDHLTIEDMSDNAKRLMYGERGLPLLLYAFGNGEVPLRMLVAERGHDGRWFARQTAGDLSSFDLVYALRTQRGQRFHGAFLS